MGSTPCRVIIPRIDVPWSRQYCFCTRRASSASTFSQVGDIAADAHVDLGEQVAARRIERVVEVEQPDARIVSWGSVFGRPFVDGLAASPCACRAERIIRSGNGSLDDHPPRRRRAAGAGVWPSSCCARAAATARPSRCASSLRWRSSQQAETVQRVERSLREQEQALSKVGPRAARPHREGHRPDRHRPARAAGPHRRGAEEDRRALDPGRQPAGSAVQQAGARRLRRGPAQRPGAERPAAARPMPSRCTLSSGVRADCLLKLPNPPGSIAIDAKFPLESYQRAARRAGGRRAGAAGGAARLPAGHPQAHRRHPRQVHRARRDRRDRR